MHRLPRHHLVWLDVDSEPRWLQSTLPLPARARLEAWLRAGRPAIVRRRAPDEPDHAIALGVPLPPAPARERIGFLASAGAVTDSRPPPLLSEVIVGAPPDWRLPLRQLDAQTRALGLELRVFGSLLWQHLTGEPYLTPRSDIDLLIRAPDGDALRAGLAGIASWERACNLRADGELLLPDGSAAAWRELLLERDLVLVKGAAGIGLRPASTIWQAWQEVPA